MQISSIKTFMFKRMKTALKCKQQFEEHSSSYINVKVNIEVTEYISKHFYFFYYEQFVLKVKHFLFNNKAQFMYLFN